MISHVVMFRQRMDVFKDERDALLQAFEVAVRDIPTIRGVRAGKRVRIGAGYERDGVESPDFIIAIDFEDVSGLQLYLQHPAHVELAARFSQACAVTNVYDFSATDDASSIRALFDAQ
jgi:stress responsive alpha/beta barrel protein